MANICTMIVNLFKGVGDTIKSSTKVVPTLTSLVAFAIYAYTFIILCVNYVDYDSLEENNSFILTRCLNAIGSAFAIMGCVVYVGEMYLSYMEKDKPPFLEIVRNFVSGGALVLVSLLLGEYTEDTSYFTEFLWAVILLIFVRVIIDVSLDDREERSALTRLGTKYTGVNEVLESKYDQIRRVKELLVSGIFIAVITLVALHMGKKTLFNNNPANHHDGLLITVLVLVSVHLAFLLAVFAYSCLKTKENSVTKELETINQVPWVSKAVFTANLVCLSLTIGERMAVDQRVVELVFALVILGMAEAVARGEM
jgi:MFS family permease